MILFFLLMSGLCAYLAWRGGDRWLVANGVVFLGLALTPALTGHWLIGWWTLISLLTALALGGACSRPSPFAPPTPISHHAVCTPYHSTSASEGRE